MDTSSDQIINNTSENVSSLENENPSQIETENSLFIKSEDSSQVTSLVNNENSFLTVETESCLPTEVENSISLEVKNCLPAEAVTLTTNNENSLQLKTETSLSQNELEDKVISDTPDVQVQKEESNLTDDDMEDLDLTAIEIATNLIEKIESPEMAASVKMCDTYENIMLTCSSTAQAIKQTISDVLKSRENIVITAADTTSELEASLNQKIADFENVVSGCFMTEADPKTDLTNIKHPAFSNVIITEVNESSENSNLNSSSKADDTEEEEGNTSINIVSSSSSEAIADSKTLQKTIEKTPETNKDSAPSTGKKSNSKEKEIAKSAKAPQNQPESVPVVISYEDDKNFKKQQKSVLNKKKGEKTVDQILKSLSHCSTTEDKLQAVCKKHLEALEELRLFEPRMKQLERQVTAQLREKEQIQAELNRMILAKSRLESLCRELQRQNKAVKEESLLHLKEEEERRKEVANKFQVTLNDISALMQEHSKKNIQLREENAELAKKLKALVDHYDMWEKHMEKVVQQSHLEAQLAKAKYAKVNLLLKQETEKFLREKQALLENMSELQKKCTMLTSNELKLRTELGDYTSKYEEFQTVLNKSSQVFATFKNDMEATSKKIKKLEKETNVYKQKWESSNNALLGMISDKQKHDKELANAHQRILTLEKLCRALQAERNDLQNQLNARAKDCSEKDVPSQPAETEVA